VVKEPGKVRVSFLKLLLYWKGRCPGQQSTYDALQVQTIRLTDSQRRQRESLVDPVYNDCKLKAMDEATPVAVHRHILRRSPYFKTMLGSGFKVCN